MIGQNSLECHFPLLSEAMSYEKDVLLNIYPMNGDTYCAVVDKAA